MLNELEEVQQEMYEIIVLLGAEQAHDSTLDRAKRAKERIDSILSRSEDELVEVVARAIVTKCVTDSLAVEPMPDDIAYSLAKAATRALGMIKGE
jgi:GTP cyclohydrolase I